MIRSARMGLALVLTLSVWVGVAMAEIAEDAVTLTVTVEERDAAPMTGEMILVTIRGQYRLPITLEKLEQPDLTGFDWMQLGADNWFETRERGLPVLNLERRMALFPDRPGEIEIGAFTHKLTLPNRTGRRIEHDAVSAPVTVRVAPRPPSDDWWFPVRHLQVSDEWSNPPESLSPGAGVLRIIVITAQGIAPERVPPMPELTGAGAHIFPHPEKRIVTLGPNGPITRAFWRWTVRPEGMSAAFLNPIRLPYFDTVSRDAREITLSAQRVAYLGATGRAQASSTEPRDAAAPAAADLGPISIPAGVSLLAALAGLVGGVVVLWPVISTPAGDLTGASVAARARARLLLWSAGLRRDVAGIWRHGTGMLDLRGIGDPVLRADLDRLAFGPCRPDDRALRDLVLRLSAARPPAGSR